MYPVSAERKRRSERLSAEEKKRTDSDMNNYSNSSKTLDHDGSQDGEGSNEGLPPPHLANAITVRWFAADLANATAAAAVHEEVRGRQCSN